MFWCALQTPPRPSFNGKSTDTPHVASMLAPPASAYAGRRYCLGLTVKFKTFFPKMLAALLLFYGLLYIELEIYVYTAQNYKYIYLCLKQFIQ